MEEYLADIVVVSDIHIVKPHDQRAKLLLSAIEEMKQKQVGCFVLLGDIFDFCLGSHPYYRQRYRHIGEALEELVKSGTEVIFMEGNHEFRAADFGWKGVQFIEDITYRLDLSNGASLQFGHGDMIFSHDRYKKFRKVVKSKWFTSLVGILPGRFMDYLATRSAAVSRAQDQYRQINHDKILEAVNGWLEAGSADYGIFGHFHVPYAEARRDGKAGGLLSSDCWDEPSMLLMKQSEFFRVKFDQDFRWQVEGLKAVVSSHTPTKTTAS